MLINSKIGTRRARPFAAGVVVATAAVAWGCGSGAPAVIGDGGAVDRSPVVDVTTPMDTAVGSDADASDPDASVLTDVTVCTAGAELCDGRDNDCNGLIDDAASEALATDPLHCGACGRSCAGGTCSNGVCSATALAQQQTRPTLLARVDRRLVWVNSSTSSSTTWAIMTCTLPDCAGSLATVISNQTAIRALAADRARVYWSAVTSNDAFPKGEVRACPLSGCAGSAPAVVVPALNVPGAVAVSDTDIYVGTYDGIVTCPSAGCGTSAPRLFVAGASSPEGLAISGQHLYWALTSSSGDSRLQTTASIGACPLSGCPAVPSTFGQSCGRATALAADDDSIYLGVADNRFCASDMGGVVQCSQPDCRASLSRSPHVASVLAVRGDGIHVYWIDPSGRIERCPVGGCGTRGRVKMTVDGAAANDLVLDEARLYFSDANAGTISSVPR